MKRFLRTLLPVLVLTAPLAVAAQQIRLLPPCTATGNCGITDILAVFINVAEYLLGISGAVALGYYVYGGFRYVISRGKPAEVQKATGILTNAVIGIAIIFLSGVLVRFTTQALTGGTSAIPTVGESCDSKTHKSSTKGDGLWVSIPAGTGSDGKAVPEGLICVKKDDCKSLNSTLKDRGLTDQYSCSAISGAVSCVRGLCPSKGADYACCLTTAAPAK